MSNCATSILIYGLNSTLLQTRRWVLQASGYQAQTATELAQFAGIPEQPSVKLLILCHSLDQQSCSDAIELADARWPGIKHLVLGSNLLNPDPGLLESVMLGLDGPSTLIANVNTLVGQRLEALQ